MANSIESAEQNTFELADAGMTCLTEKFGAAGAEAFITPIRREKLDYTKWRREYYGEMKPKIERKVSVHALTRQA